MELSALLASLDEAEAGRGGLILLGGEPGIGKSRLADEVAVNARGRGSVVLWGRGWEDAGAPPYWPWVQVLRSYFRQTDVDVARRQLGSAAADLAQMLPEVRDLIPDLAAPAAGESDAARFQLFDSATSYLRSAAEERFVDFLQARQRSQYGAAGRVAHRYGVFIQRQIEPWIAGGIANALVAAGQQVGTEIAACRTNTSSVRRWNRVS